MATMFKIFILGIMIATTGAVSASAREAALDQLDRSVTDRE